MTAVSTSDARTQTIQVGGDNALQALKPFSGTHRVQRVPENSAKGRKHTSTATIAVLAQPREAEVTLSDSDLRIDRIRGHGRGGQRRNKLETAIRLTHLPTGLVVTRMSGRSQSANIDDAKRDLLSQLKNRDQQRIQASTQDARRVQVDSERSGKDFTHCWYRNEVVQHSTGQRWTIRQWKQGRL